MNCKLDYKVIGRIGEGAHGIVLKAKNRRTGKLVALKRMLNNKGDEKIELSLLREIKSLQQVKSKYVSFVFYLTLTKVLIKSTKKIFFFNNHTSLNVNKMFLQF